MTPPPNHYSGEDGVPVRELVVQLGALLGGVAVSSSDKITRRRAIRSLCQVLSTRGLDADSLVRHGMQSLVVDPLLAWMMLEATLRTAPAQHPHVDIAGWKELLGDFSFSLSEDTKSLDITPEAANRFSTASAALRIWVEEAGFDDLIDRAPPSQAEYRRISNRPRASSSPMREMYTWVYQRLALTDLEKWDESSLHNELRFVLGLIPPPITPEIMDIVGVDEGELSRVIARRAISRSGNEQLSPLLAPLQDEASRLLGQRRFREASVLFEFYQRQRPDEATAVNNRGFCLIPVSASEALHHLRSAEGMGYPATAVLVYNFCCCYEALGEHARLIDRAESYWQRERDATTPSAATLWTRNSQTWDLYHESDVPAAIARIALNSARTLGLADRIPVWVSRLNAPNDESR